MVKINKMIAKKLTLLLQTFSSNEHTQFRKYLLSPFFNENKTLLKLYDIFAKNLKARQPFTDKNAIWSRLCPKLAYNDVRFRKYCSDLTRLGENFLIYYEFDTNEVGKNIHLLRSLNKRQLDQHFSAKETKTRRTIEALSHRDINYHLQYFLLENEVDKFQIRRIKRTNKITLEDFDQSLDNFYLTQKLKNYCNSLNYKNIVNKDFEIGFIQLFINELNKDIETRPPSVQVYYQVMLTLSEIEDETHFYRLREVLNTHGDLFPQPELRDLYIFAQNYCIKKINTGKKEYFKQLFDIYNTLLEKGTIFNNGELLPWDFKNMVAVGLRIGEFDWIENIIRKYSDHLPDDFRENAITYNLATVYFYKREYDKVIELLREVEYQDLYYAMDGKWLLIKTYYELDEPEPMEALLESFRIFLLRNKLISKVKERQYLNLIRFVKKMNQLPYNSQQAAQKLQKKIEESGAVADKKWLLEKIEIYL